jgi:GT2 family glycosyltransferase
MTPFLPWKIVHADLSKPLEGIQNIQGFAGVYCVIWCDRIPVGHLSIPASLLPLTASQFAGRIPKIIAPAVADRIGIRGFRAPLPVDPEKQIPQEPATLAELSGKKHALSTCAESFYSSPDTSEDSTPADISIVVCTRNRPEALQKCLDSLRALTRTPGEIIVVDNDPASGMTTPVIASDTEIRYVAAPRHGLSAARNAGIQNSKRDIIAFTDDDATVHPEWIRAIETVFRDREIMATTGLVLPAELSTPAQYAFQGDNLGWGWGYRVQDFGQEFFRSMKPVGVPTWRMGAGANMAFRRGVFDRVGFFDERLGAGTSGCSEDSEMWYRLLAEGYRCRYEPAAVVFHSHRTEWSELRVQTFSYMRGHVAALLFQFDRYGHWGNVRRAFVKLPAYYAQLACAYARRNIGRWILPPHTEAPHLPLSDQLRGVLAGYAYYFRNRRRPVGPEKIETVAEASAPSVGAK